jgi:hypothetical protein
VLLDESRFEEKGEVLYMPRKAIALKNKLLMVMKD